MTFSIRNKTEKRLCLSLLAAAILWFYMFSPWTAGHTNFWITMSCSGLILSTFVFFWSKDTFENIAKGITFRQLIGGFAIAAPMWGVFWIGDKMSSWLFDFARPQVDNIYNMKEGLPLWSIALLLCFIIGPAEEIFWRGYIQKTLNQLFTPLVSFIITLLVYTFIHVWSFNFMLIMAAMVAGAVWGFLYWIRPNWLPALVLSHAIWDCCTFVVFPI